MAIWGAEMEGVETLQADLDEFKHKWTATEEIVWVVGTHVKYAIPVEFGTDPHMIRPDDAQVLHFQIDGEDVFTNVADHPGTRPQPFMRPASETTRAELGKIVGEANDLEEALEKIAFSVERHAKQYAPVESGNLRASIRAKEET